MNIQKIWSVSFSPTGTSKKIVDTIASGFEDIEQKSIDLTCVDTIESKTFSAEDLVVIGVPVYAGRVAPLAVRRLQQIKGNNTPAVLVVLYGNREYEDALVELRDIAENASFLPVAAAAFIGEHSFSSPEEPIAEGRPDEADCNMALSFYQKIFDKLATEGSSPTQLKVPGNVPYKEGMGGIPVTPEVNQQRCTQCGECVSACPTQAMTLEEELAIDVERCIFCCACIKNCQEGAISISAAGVKEKRQWLHQNCSTRKEPELFL